MGHLINFNLGKAQYAIIKEPDFNKILHKD